MREVAREEASALAGLPVARGGLYFGDGLLVRPQALIDSLLAQPGIARITGRAARLARGAHAWQVLDGEGRLLAEGEQVILANALGARIVLQDSGLLDGLPRLAQMHALAGEVSHVPAARLAGGPRCIVAGEGYLLPAVDGWCVAGSTYAHGASASEVSRAGRQTNLDKVAGLLGEPLGERRAPPCLAGPAARRAAWPAACGGRVAAGARHQPGHWLCLARPELVGAHGRCDRRPALRRTPAPGDRFAGFDRPALSGICRYLGKNKSR